VTLTLTLDLVILHTTSCITRRPLPTYRILQKSKKLFVDGRTDGSRPKKQVTWPWPLPLVGSLSSQG